MQQLKWKGGQQNLKTTMNVSQSNRGAREVLLDVKVTPADLCFR